MIRSEIGSRYRKLIVIEETSKRYHSTRIVRCRCDCGNEIELTISKLHSGHTKSCGCLKHRVVDLTGQRFSRLQVVEFAYTKNRKNYWKYLCDCGNTCFVDTASLRNGTTVSCGCKNKENRANVKNLDSGLVDGTRKSSIKKDRKVNKNNKSGVTGVSYDSTKGLWVAQITFQNKNHCLGRYKTKSEAIKARKNGEEQYFSKYR